MEPRAIIGRVVSVEPHPENANLTNKMDVVKINDAINVSTRPSPDKPRYEVGDYAVVLPENLVLPEWLLKHMDLWNSDKNKGYLAGSKGNRTKAREIAGVLSEVALCKVDCRPETPMPINEGGYDRRLIRICIAGDDWTWLLSEIVPSGTTKDYDPTGKDMTKELEITPYIPKP